MPGTFKAERERERQRERQRERETERERDVASNLPDKCELALRSIVGLERGEVLKQKAL